LKDSRSSAFFVICHTIALAMLMTIAYRILTGQAMKNQRSFNSHLDG